MDVDQKKKKTIEIIVTAITALLSLWFVASCTMSMNVAKNNNCATQSAEQKQATSVDSTKVSINPK